jgi:hypothetical protein
MMGSTSDIAKFRSAVRGQRRFDASAFLALGFMWIFQEQPTSWKITNAKNEIDTSNQTFGRKIT